MDYNDNKIMQNLTEDKLNANTKFLWELYLKCNTSKYEFFESISKIGKFCNSTIRI